MSTPIPQSPYGSQLSWVSLITPVTCKPQPSVISATLLESPALNGQYTIAVNGFWLLNNCKKNNWLPSFINPFFAYFHLGFPLPKPNPWNLCICSFIKALFLNIVQHLCLLRVLSIQVLIVASEASLLPLKRWKCMDSGVI